MGEERRLVLQELVVDAIERVLFRQRKIRAEQIAHRTALEPLAVQAPFAARIDEPVANQRLEDVPPARAFAAVGQALRPERVEPELLVKVARQPARAPLPRPVQFEVFEPHAHAAVRRVRRHFAIPREERQRARPGAILIEALDDAAPRRALAVVDLAEIKHWPLHDPAARATAALGDRPVAMFLAVFFAPRASQKHDGSSW